MSTYTSTLSDYSRAAEEVPVEVGFVDVEGQGDESEAYDALLVTPLLLLSKVILFNWKGGVEKTSMLKLLATLAHAASKIDTGAAEDEPIFGHLHIVFRDWVYIGAQGDSDDGDDDDDDDDSGDDDDDDADDDQEAKDNSGTTIEEKVLSRLMDEEDGSAPKSSRPTRQE